MANLALTLDACERHVSGHLHRIILTHKGPVSTSVNFRS